MRFKTGRRVEITNKEVPASLRKISRNNKVEPSDCLKAHENDARLRKPKRASPFGSLHPKSKKVKLAENDCGQSQRHSFKKVDAFEERQLEACFFASKGSKRDSGSVDFQLVHSLQIRQVVDLLPSGNNYNIAVVVAFIDPPPPLPVFLKLLPLLCL